MTGFKGAAKAVVLLIITTAAIATVAWVISTFVSQRLPDLIALVRPTHVISVDSFTPGEYLKIGKRRVTTVAYAPDGQNLAVSTSTGIYLYNTMTYQIRLVITTTVWTDHASFSPDSKLIAVHVGNEVIIFDAATGVRIRSLVNNKDASIGDVMEWSPDSRYIASVALMMYYTEVWIWDVTTGTRAKTLVNTNRFPYAEGISWSHDGRELVVSYRYGETYAPYEIYIWDVRTEPEILRRWQTPAQMSGKLTWSANGKYILLSGGGDFISFDANNGSIITASSVLSETSDFSLSTDGNYVAIGAAHKPLIICDVPALTVVHELRGAWAGADSVSWSPAGDIVATSNSFDDSFYLWSLSTGMLVEKVSLDSHWNDDLSWSSDSSMIAAGGRDNQVRIYSSIDGSLIRTLGLPNPGNRTLVGWSFDDRWLAWSGGDTGKDELRLWSVESMYTVGIPVNSFEAPIAWSPVTNSLAIINGTSNRTLQVWSVGVNGEVTLLRQAIIGDTNSDNVTTLSWSPDGQKLVTGVAIWDDSKAKFTAKLSIWHATDLELLYEIKDVSMEWIRSAAWSPDGKWIAASYDISCPSFIHSYGSCAELHVWSADKGRELIRYSTENHSSSATSWSYDSQWLVASQSYNNITLYPITEGKQVRSISAHHGEVESVRWSPDGRLIASAGIDGVIYIWKADVLTSDAVLSR